MMESRYKTCLSGLNKMENSIFDNTCTNVPKIGSVWRCIKNREDQLVGDKVLITMVTYDSYGSNLSPIVWALWVDGTLIGRKTPMWAARFLERFEQLDKEI